MSSYHDLFITTSNIPRTPIFDLPMNLMLICTRSGGWELWENPFTDGKVIASEFADLGAGLRLDVRGHVIVDSLTQYDPEAKIQIVNSEL